MSKGSEINTMENGKKRLRVSHWRLIALALLVYDFAALLAGYFLALLARFDFVYSQIPSRYLQPYFKIIPVYAAASVLAFLCFGLYRVLWQFSGVKEAAKVMGASFVMSGIHSLAMILLFDRMPLSYHLVGAMFQFILLLFPRIMYRVARLLYRMGTRFRNTGRVMIVGAGSAGRTIARQMQNDRDINERVMCFIDDAPGLRGGIIDGIPVVGGREDISRFAQKYQITKILFCIPRATSDEKVDILTLCNEARALTKCEVMQLPGIADFVNGKITLSSLKKVNVEDLLGREPKKMTEEEKKEVFDFIEGKTVLVTGGGGSIGSEICRQIAEKTPKRLIIYDIYENNAYAIQLELRKKHPELDLVVLIGSVRDSRKMYDLFETYKPEIVYHAAAHKHVPLMEDSPCEAIKNNAIGTYKTAYAAMVHGCERFVLISTDKAVNPTNMMGASKRLCEMIIQSFDAKIKAGKASEIPQIFTHVGEENADKDGTGRVFENIKTEFVAVRFGNVLGSNGSVIPIFMEQIEHGGPVEVTDPRIIRYFMTIPEAVGLVLLAGTYAHGGEIFVLDMGKPVRIVDLAKQLIIQSGHSLEEIKIEYIGLRPGEKLFEAKLMSEEGNEEKTRNDTIFIGKPKPFEIDTFFVQLRELMNAAYSNSDKIKEMVKEMVETYHPEKGGEGAVIDQDYVNEAGMSLPVNEAEAAVKEPEPVGV